METISAYRDFLSVLFKEYLSFHHPITGYTATKFEAARSAAVPCHISECIEPLSRLLEPITQCVDGPLVASSLLYSALLV